MNRIVANMAWNASKDMAFGKAYQRFLIEFYIVLQVCKKFMILNIIV